MNDLFGIQSRAGCMCAALYGFRNLNIHPSLALKYKEAMQDGLESLRIGYTRLSINFFIAEEEIDYVLFAVDFVAKYAWMFLPLYMVDSTTGIWKNKDDKFTNIQSRM